MKISVVLPVFNGFPQLEVLLLSLITDLESGDEVIVVNDGSKDEPSTRYLNLEELNPAIKMINQAHGGIVSALNHGISRARNPLIARLDVDDAYHAGRFHHQRKLFEEDPELILAFTDYVIVSEKQKYLGYIPSAVTDYAVKLSLINPSRTAHPSAMFRKVSFLNSNGYRQQDFPAEDLALWIRMIDKGKFASIPQPYLTYTLSPNGITSNRRHAMNSKVSEFQHPLRSKLLLSTSEAKKTLTLYSSCSHKSERCVLLAKDSLKILVLCRKFDFFNLILVFKILFQPTSIFAILKLWQYKNLRMRQRSKANY